MVDAPGPGEIVERHRADPPPLPERDRLDGLAAPRRPARPHFHEHNRPAVLADDVNFSKASAVASGKNCVPAAAQFAAREIFPSLSEDLAIDAFSHACKSSNTDASRAPAFMSFTYFMTFMRRRNASMSGQMFAPLRLWPENG